MELSEARKAIDAVDEQLVALFCQRMGLSAEVARQKQEQDLPVLNKGREREVLKRVSDLAGPELEGYVWALYSTLFSVSKAYQTSLIGGHSTLVQDIEKAIQNTPEVFPQKGVVACQGVEGAYSQMACDRLFHMPDILYFRSFEGVFQAVEKGLCRFGVLPIENSSFGSVNEVYDLMRGYRFHIVKSMRLHISHALLAKNGVVIEDIREIVSHEQAIGQCSAFLAKHPEITVTIVENTALAAKMVAESNRRDLAALSAGHCAELYGLTVLSTSVQNNANNYTRFICIQKDMAIYPGSDRISLMCSVPHRPGSLYEMMSRFASLGLNLTKLESRPIPGRDFEFMFYFDLEASVWTPEVLQLMGELSSTNDEFVFLGSYSEL